jgi:hypothetical protein
MIEATELRRRLVAALRSGKFQQTRHALKRDAHHENGPPGHCCLGVACEVYDEAFPADPCDRSPYKQNGDDRIVLFDGKPGGLPPKVQAAFGFCHPMGQWGRDHLESLANHNDTGASFEQIAQMIEAPPPGLFGTPIPGKIAGGTSNL